MALSGDLAKTLLELAPDATVVVDTAGTIVFANAQVERTFGYPPDELLGKTVEVLLPTRFRAVHGQHRARFARQPKSRAMGEALTLFGQHRSGHEFPIEISLSPVRSSDGDLVVAAVRDATLHRNTEHELIEANRAKSHLLAAASHDLRQPVQTLSLLQHAALRYADHSAGLRDILQRQRNALETMTALLSSVLDLSKLDAGAIQPTLGPRSIQTVFAQLRSDFEPQASQAGLTLIVEPTTESGHTDTDLLRRLLGNLLSNAIRYTATGSVRLWCELSGNELRISVEDTGIGIPAHETERIFEEFYQIDRGPARTDGLGLGLSIVRRLARLLNHSVAVHSAVGRGTTFTITLPRADAAAAAAERPAVPARAPRDNKRVLVIEDEPAVAEATRLLLEIEGYAVDIATGLDSARMHARAHAPDIIVSDFHLRGDFTGSDAVAAVRAAVGTTVPAIFVTGDTSKFARTGVDLPLTRILSKPTRAEDLLGAVRAQLGAT